MFSEPAFRKLLAKHPRLGASGLSGTTAPEPATEQERLQKAYAEFALCCEWLLDCTPMGRVSCVAPWSSELRTHIERQAGVRICHGALIAAVLHLRLPYHHPDGSSDVRVGISVRSPALRAEPGEG